MRRAILAMLLSMALLLPYTLPVFAAEGNMDGGGGEMGSGTGESYWNGSDGVRITVIDKKTKNPIGSSFDWSKYSIPSDVVSFVRKNKIQYCQRGASLVPKFDDYDYNDAPAGMPTVISSNASSNIAAVKDYFTDEGRIRAIAQDSGISYDNLISGKFTVLIEPIAYFKYNGSDYAMTATEAALYDRIESGNLRKKMGTLTHQNLPLAMFLELDELGIAAWSGGGGIVSDENIISYLGIGTVNFGDALAPPGGVPPAAETYDYEYRANTDVVTSILVSASSEINPDAPGRARFQLPTGTVSVEYVIPAGESQLVWVKWRTPDVDAVIDIPVSINRGNISKSTIKVKISKLEENTPPDPEGRDRNDGFSLKDPPLDEWVSSLTWGEWWAQWHPFWVLVTTPCYAPAGVDCETDHSYWEDRGWWDFFWRSYSASLGVTAKLRPDERVPTARADPYGGFEMKSAYGINALVDVHVTTNSGAASVSEVQHIIAVFPEFDFETFNRLLEPDDGMIAYTATWQFRENEYSQFVNPVHFTPIWYPDHKKYPVTFTVLDAWTPAGMLYEVVTADNITINGNVYQDWRILPGIVDVP